MKIPSTIEYIDEYAFTNCESLKIIYNNSNLAFTVGSQDYGYISLYAEKIYNKGEWSCVNDAPVPNQ